MRFVLDYLRPGDVFVDVGANVGSYTLLAGKVPGVHVVAFEPASSTFSRLSENVVLNRLTNVTLHQCAVGQADTEALLTLDNDTMNQIVPVGDESGRTEKVRMVRLDTIIGDQSDVALVKIDVEGHEPEVLAGAEQLLRRCRPALIVEYNDHGRLTKFFNQVDYRPVFYRPDERKIQPLRTSPDGRIAASARPGHSANIIAVAAENLDHGVQRRLTATTG
ncbi:FkbM family methyltransferase [Parafrankia sp. FMc2]|uniref:FkbM family methyltransferase n=1 Tax=Parafrankia sp. FMc2 TaxID=3233196 RepID=UPI0034D50B3A